MGLTAWPRVFARRTPCTLGLHEYAPVQADTTDTIPHSPADGLSPDKRSLLCLVLPAPRLPHRTRSAGRGAGGAVLLHIAVLTTLLVTGARSGSTPEPSQATASSRQPLQLPRIVFLQMPGPGGGGGGGGNRQPKPSRAQASGRDRLTLPVAKPIIVSEQPKDVILAPQQMVLDAKPLASGTTSLIGLPDAPSSLPFSQGPGFGGGVGEGTGTGIGSGTGPGVGPGSGGGFGGGAYRLGSGVTPPTLLKQVKPRYTAEGLRLRIQGTVALEVVVSRDGIPIAIRITRSLDPGGLDEEAIVAVREWRFTPGRIGDTPVDVLVTILLDFNVR
jgi:protein TonB